MNVIHNDMYDSHLKEVFGDSHSGDVGHDSDVARQTEPGGVQDAVAVHQDNLCKVASLVKYSVFDHKSGTPSFLT